MNEHDQTLNSSACELIQQLLSDGFTLPECVATLDLASRIADEELQSRLPANRFELVRYRPYKRATRLLEEGRGSRTKLHIDRSHVVDHLG